MFWFLKKGNAPAVVRNGDAQFSNVNDAIKYAKNNSFEDLKRLHDTLGLNWGIYLSDWVIIDVDSKNAKDKEALNDAIINDLINTNLDRYVALYWTKSRGLHIIFKSKHHIQQTNKVIRTNGDGAPLIEVIYHQATLYNDNHEEGFLTYEDLTKLPSDLSEENKTILFDIINRYGEKHIKPIYKRTKRNTLHLSPMEKANESICILDFMSWLGFNNVGYEKTSYMEAGGGDKWTAFEDSNKAYSHRTKKLYSICDMLYHYHGLKFNNGGYEVFKNEFNYLDERIK